MYCVNCGVELAATEKVCPLCGVPAYHPHIRPGTDEPMFPVGRRPVPQVPPRTAQIILTTLFLLPLLITLLCDLQINRAVTWSGFVAGALLVAYTILVLPLWFRRRPAVVFIPVGFLAVGLYVLYINCVTGGHWFLSFAFPVLGFLCLLTTAEAALLCYVRRGKLYIFGGAFLALGAFMPLMEYLIVYTFQRPRFAAWSLYPMTALVLLGGMLIFLALNAKARQTMERKFFL